MNSDVEVFQKNGGNEERDHTEGVKLSGVRKRTETERRSGSGEVRAERSFRERVPKVQGSAYFRQMESLRQKDRVGIIRISMRMIIQSRFRFPGIGFFLL